MEQEQNKAKPKADYEVKPFRLSPLSEMITDLFGNPIQMPDVLLDFMEPLYAYLDGDDQSCDVARKVASFAWNLSYLPDNEVESAIQDLRRQGTFRDMQANETEEFWPIIDTLLLMLVRNRRSQYPHIRRHILSSWFGNDPATNRTFLEVASEAIPCQVDLSIPTGQLLAKAKDPEKSSNVE